MTAKTAAKGGFTPGPWIVDGKYIREVKPWDEEGRQLAVALVTNTSRVIGEVRANARLIAAAPQLYRLLKEFVDDGECYCADNVAGSGTCPIHEAQKLLEAIHG